MQNHETQDLRRKVDTSLITRLKARSLWLRHGAAASIALVATLALANPVRLTMGLWADMLGEPTLSRGTPLHSNPLDTRERFSLMIRTPDRRGAKKLPVVVLIEANARARLSNSSAQESELVDQGFIVVTLTPSDFIPKNSAGLSSRKCMQMDSLSALRWVDRNIETFGGDSKRVAVFEE